MIAKAIDGGRDGDAGRLHHGGGFAQSFGGGARGFEGIQYSLIAQLALSSSGHGRQSGPQQARDFRPRHGGASLGGLGGRHQAGGHQSSISGGGDPREGLRAAQQRHPDVIWHIGQVFDKTAGGAGQVDAQVAIAQRAIEFVQLAGAGRHFLREAADGPADGFSG